MIASPRAAARLTHWLLAFLAVGVWGLLLRPYLPIGTAGAQPSAAVQSTTFDTLTVQRINLVDPDGKFRLVIANSARLPDAILRGKTYPRSVNDTAGLIFYNAQGDETGGIVLGEQHGHEISGLIFDCSYQPTDCIRIWKQESTDGAQLRESLDIFDRRPHTGVMGESSQGIRRITLGDENQNAQLLIADPQGRPRIRIGVDKAGEASMVMLSPDGKEVYRAGR